MNQMARNDSEVSTEELESLGIKVSLETMEIQSWEKSITLELDGQSYPMTLFWDKFNGYQLDHSEKNLPEIIYELMGRPEFEYVLDCITVEQERWSK